MAGQTLSEIRSLLAAAGLAPLHRFGQNFLIDLNLMRKVVEAAALSAGDVVLEIGPGTGSLTALVLESGARVVAVEIDRGLQGILAQRFANEARFRLIAGDALARKNELNPLIATALDEMCGNGRAHPLEAGATQAGATQAGATRAGAPAVCKLVANLPYQIATPVILELLAREPRVATLVCTIQKEVGEKLSAPPGGADYGPLAILTQTVARAERIALLQASAFWPAPRVDSVLMRMRRKPPEQITVADVPGFAAFVRESFQQRRKTIRNAAKRWRVASGEWRVARTMPDLPALDIDRIFAACGVSATQRPEELSPETWQRLFRCVRAGVDQNRPARPHPPREPGV